MTNLLNIVDYMNIYEVRLPMGSLCQNVFVTPSRF